MGYTRNTHNFFGYGLGQTTGRAGPNHAGGLTTTYSNDLVFNPDQYDIIYNVSFLIGRPNNLPQGYVPPSQVGLPAAVATWIWDPKGGPAPWPGQQSMPAGASVSSTNAATSSTATPAMSTPLIAPSTSSSIPTSTLVNTGASLVSSATGLPNPLATPIIAPAPVATSSSSTGIIAVVAIVGIAALGFFFLRHRKKTPSQRRK